MIPDGLLVHAPVFALRPEGAEVRHGTMHRAGALKKGRML